MQRLVRLYVPQHYEEFVALEDFLSSSVAARRVLKTNRYTRYFEIAYIAQIHREISKFAEIKPKQEPKILKYRIDTQLIETKKYMQYGRFFVPDKGE